MDDIFESRAFRVLGVYILSYILGAVVLGFCAIGFADNAHVARILLQCESNVLFATLASLIVFPAVGIVFVILVMLVVMGIAAS